MDPKINIDEVSVKRRSDLVTDVWTAAARPSHSPLIVPIQTTVGVIVVGRSGCRLAISTLVVIWSVAPVTPRVEGKSLTYYLIIRKH